MASGIPRSGSGRSSAARRTPQTTAPDQRRQEERARRSRGPRARPGTIPCASRVLSGVVGHVALLEVHQREAAGPLPDDGARLEAAPGLPPPRAPLVARRAHQAARIVGDGVAALPAELGAAVADPAAGGRSWPRGCPRPRPRRRRGRWPRPGARRARSRARWRGAPQGGQDRGDRDAERQTPPQAQARPTRAGRSAPGRPTAAGRSGRQPPRAGRTTAPAASAANACQRRGRNAIVTTTAATSEITPPRE